MTERSERPAGLARTLAVAGPARRRIAQASLLGAGAIGASIALMGTSAWLISRAAQHPSEASLTLAIVGVQFFGLSRGFLRYGERLVGHDAALRMLAGLRVYVYTRLEALAPAGLPAFRRGDLVSRVVDDVDSLQDVVLRVIQPFAVAALVGCGTVAAMWWLLPQAGLVLLVALALSATAVPWLTGRLARREEARQASVRGALHADVLDLVEGAAELVVLGAADDQLARIRAGDGALRSVARRGAGTTGIGLGLTTALAGLASWGALALGVGPVHAGSLNGALLAVLALVPLAAFELVSPLPAGTQALARARVAAGRVFEAVDAPPVVHDPRTPVALELEDARPDRPRRPHTLVLHDVWASYPGAGRAALRGVDLALAPGRRVAVVGPSGAGKSTLADVLVRFLPADDGEAVLDGVPLERLRADDVRRVVGLVEQRPHLFDTSLGENLRIGRREATDDELAAVMARVGLGDWLAGLPDGLATPTGRDGSRLSGGQRQRVAVARALLADFPILVLDEPAEHLEPAAADALTGDLLALTVGRSSLLITHRLAGLEAVDEILVLDGGRVVERGTHTELLTAGGRYAGLWWEERLNDQPAAGPWPATDGRSTAIPEGSDPP
ncbi:MAG TPA: thiol reductant ABC exporter subunit CydC [Acidimicrobiales bacterium]|nr:thiol reductant ABC exporter subunit CydC [Acidimicrobiales bacterium]